MSGLAADKTQNNHHPHADAKHAIGDIKSRPMVLTIVDINKIPDQPVVINPVIKISAYPCGKERQDNVNNFMLYFGEEKNRKNSYQGND